MTATGMLASGTATHRTTVDHLVPEDGSVRKFQGRCLACPWTGVLCATRTAARFEADEHARASVARPIPAPIVHHDPGDETRQP